LSSQPPPAVPPIFGGRSPRTAFRRAFLAVMVLVTAWSFWAWAQPAKPSATEEPAEAESEAPAPINWTEFGKETPPFIATLINFGILAAGYYLLGKKPIAAGLLVRRDAIAREIEEAQRMKLEAEERAKTYQAKLESLEHEVRMAREALVRAGEAERERIVTEAEAKAQRMRKDAEFLVEQELKQMRHDLWREAVEVAVSSAEEMLKKRVTPADQERLAEAFLSDLGERSKAVPGAGSQETARAAEPGASEAS
jgi:F0F1-type ATP synthase membrane subunit b/b'